MKRVARAMTEVQPGTEPLTGTGRIPQQTKRTRQTVLANSLRRAVTDVSLRLSNGTLRVACFTELRSFA